MHGSGLHIQIRGTVQGVGFRPWVYRLANRLGVGGRVWNDTQGVVIDAHGPSDVLEQFVAGLRQDVPPAARVRSLTCAAVPFQAVTTFTIVESRPVTGRFVSIPADLATCADCLDELFDPENRRYGYPFINCTNCGPRYSILRGAPYDRATTSMASFPMCSRCRTEYDAPSNRRFHAEANCCSVCGPTLSAVTPRNKEVGTNDPIRFAARALAAHLVVAVKGIGGFHLACDATSEAAVHRLRERKRREARPLAVMVADLDAADRVAELSSEERTLLTSVERPIVLVPRREGADIATEVCDASPLIGVFLPYTPLHHLLLREAGRPLVMTSGNVSDEPMVTTNEAALEKLGDIADLFLLHDRDIVSRGDDSLAQVVGGAPMILRRARGWVPRAVELPKPVPEPILACGGHLKNTFCLAVGSEAFLGPHIGDLDSADTFRDFEAAVERMKDFVGVSPSVLAHDMHPDYLSTRYAQAQRSVRTVPVQHHHAHVVSAMAEHGLGDRVIGVAYDGTGLGTDGTSWGGEILIASRRSFERFATFRPIPLAGGEQAIRQPWRAALALLDDAFDGQPPLHAIPLFRQVSPRAIDAVRRMIARGLNSPPARGVGRYFDAFGAFALGLPDAHYEGEIAFRWNMVADERESGRYPISVDDGSAPWVADLRPMVRAAVDDLRRGTRASLISARFHNTLAALTVELARAALGAHGALPVVLSGGCFQNARLTSAVMQLLAPRDVFVNRSVPPGDGGVALGQAVVAAATISAAPVLAAEGDLACV